MLVAAYPRVMSLRAAVGALIVCACLAACSSSDAEVGRGADPDELQATARVEFVEPDVSPSPRPSPSPSASPNPTPSPTVAPAPSVAPSEPFGTSEVVLRAPDGNGVAVGVYVAADAEQRGFGLMEREDLVDGTGMIFLFPRDTSGAFFMYRTLIPLSIAFVREDGTIVSVLDMEPCPAEDPDECPLYSPGGPYRSALEVEQGFFDEIGLDEAWTVELADDLPTPS